MPKKSLWFLGLTLIYMAMIQFIVLEGILKAVNHSPEYYNFPENFDSTATTIIYGVFFGIPILLLFLRWAIWAITKTRN